MKEPSSLQKLYQIFTPAERKYSLVILVLSLMTGIAQSLGVLSVLPFINVVLYPDIIFENDILRWFYTTFGFQRALHFLIFLGGVVFLALLFSNGISAFTIWAKVRFVTRRNHYLSTRLLTKYLSNPYPFFLKRNSNELSKNILAEVGILTKDYLMSLLELITNSFILLFILITILIVDFTASFFAILIFGTLYGTIMLMLRKRLRRRGQLSRTENKKRYRYTNEALSSFKTTKVNHAEPYFIEQYGKASFAFANHNTYAQVVGSMPRFIIEAVAAGGLVVFVVVQLALGRDLESLAPAVGVLGFAGYRMLPALQNAFQKATKLQYARPVLDRIYDDLMEAKSMDLDAATKLGTKTLAFDKKLVLKEVSFAYEGTTHAVLHKLSLTIPKNHVVGFVGETGSGKTTLIDIVMGLLEPHQGELLVDGIPINEENVRQWQKNIGYVPQEIYLTDDSLMRNIAFGLPENEVDETRIKEVAKLAALSTFIETELPEGYHTVVGERGVRLSGGQRQRIGIARALYRNPSVLVLDEATSALDGTTEEAVLQAIRSAAKERTVIMVAHRLNTLIDCDVIYLLEKGNVVASGTYQKLLETNETFQRMAKEPKDSKLG